MTTADRLIRPALRVRAGDMLAAEWLKLRTVRTTYWLLLVAVVTGIGFSAVLAVAFSAPPKNGSPAPGGLLEDPLLPMFLSLEYAVLAVGVLGALSFTTEYSTGLIRTTFAAAPRRRAVLAAKAAVTGAVSLVAGQVVAWVSFLLVQAILNSHHRGTSLGAPGVVRAVLVNGCLLALCALIGVALGAALRHTAAAIAVLVAVVFLPATLGLLPPPWNDRIGRYAFYDAAQQAATVHPSPGLLAPGWSVLVMLAWPAAALLLAAGLIARRDT